MPGNIIIKCVSALCESVIFVPSSLKLYFSEYEKRINVRVIPFRNPT